MLMHLRFDALSFDEIFHARNFQSALRTELGAEFVCAECPERGPWLCPAALGQLCPSQPSPDQPGGPVPNFSDAKVRPPWAEAPI